MTYKSSRYNNWWWFCCLALCIVVGCSSLPEGFTALDDQVAKRLVAFGAGDIDVARADFVLIKWQNLSEAKDSVALWHEALVPSTDWSVIVQNDAIRNDIQSLEDGAMVEYLAPGGAFGPSDFKNQSHFLFTVEKCFEDKRSAARYLANTASEGIRSEAESMDLFTVLSPELNWVPINDLWLGFKKSTQGDSILADRKVVIQYHTYLMGGEQLDSLTTMEVLFGKSGQLLPAMQWGLAHMREDESAIILSPSQWAFGENGSASSKIPPHTPVYWDVWIEHVGE